jgi:hypothetical protein
MSEPGVDRSRLGRLFDVRLEGYGEPSTKWHGLLLAYAGVVATLPVALFPMFPRWWFLAWCVLLVGPLWFRARRVK